ncbi:hypothetical protein GCM10022393_09450 [Aquimarina addita]|uniref:Uncharacterized protein n=1 Tax=Aquimarina addita TaxID=870485 RepID=A0ABP7XCJ6_9FLAO
MNKFYKITIPKPCHEDWSTMTPNEKGRFCGSCAKTVVDFTKFSTRDIQNFLLENQHKKMCGHFKKTQLDAIHLTIPMQIVHKSYSFRKAFLLAFLIAMGTTLVNCTNTEGKQQKIDTIEVIDIPTLHVPEIVNIDSTLRKCTKTAEKNKQNNANNTPKKPKPPVIQEYKEYIDGGIEIIPPPEPIEIFDIQGDIIYEPETSEEPIPFVFLELPPSFILVEKNQRTPENFQ